MPYYVYILQCEDNSYYTGYTKNVDKRLNQHRNGKGARYTRIHKPKQLVHLEEFGSRAEAMKREKTLKKLDHRQKMKLARADQKRKRR